MRIGIFADTHDELQRTRLAVDLLRLESAETLLHCGDLNGPEIVEACAVLPFYFVFGNHDADMAACLKRAADETGAVCLDWGDVVELGGWRIGLTHGHMKIDLRHVLAKHPDYLFTGHSHMASDRREGPVRRINPGALHRASEYSVALLDLDTDELKFLPVP